MHMSRLTIAAATVLAVEALALLVITFIEVFGLSSGSAASLPSALGLIGLSAVGAVGLAALAYAVLRGRSFGRSGGLVVQIIAIATGLSAVGARPFPADFVLGLMIPGVLGGALLILDARRAAAEARRRADDEAQGPGDTGE